MTPHVISPFAYLNFIVALAVVVLGLWYAVYGRRLDRGMMLTNVGASFWVLAVYLLIFYDRLVKDVVSESETTIFLIRPALFVLLATKLANVIRIGRRRDEH